MIRGTPALLLESVSLVDTEEWHLIILGDVTDVPASIVSLLLIFMEEHIPSDKHPRGQISTSRDASSMVNEIAKIPKSGQSQNTSRNYKSEYM